MLKSDIKFAVRSLFSQKFYSLINLIGLSTGLAAFILILLFVRMELSYDRNQEDSEDIYRIVREEYTCSPPPMAHTLKESIPEIKYASRFIVGNNLLLGVNDMLFTEDNYFWADNEFLSIFPLEFIQGNSATALKSPADIIISESLAHKYFGTNNPVGAVIKISRKDEYRVAGVFRDFPANTHFRFNIVLPIERYFETTGNDPESWRSNYVYTYVKLHPGADLSAANKKLTDIEKELTGWTASSGKPYEQYFFFQPITEIHLFSHRKQEIEANSDIGNVYIFSSIGLLILLIAIINYINLATAMASKREREMAMKKALGARKFQLINLVLTESVMVALASTFMASVIAMITLPYFGDLVNRDIVIGIKELPFLIPALILLAVLVGFAAGTVPSGSLSRVSLISVIKQSGSKRGAGVTLRNMLVLSQFIVAIILIIVTINMQRQLRFITSMDPGYDKEHIINLRIMDRSIRPDMELIKEALVADRNILQVSTSGMLPHQITEFTRPDWFCDDPQDCLPISYNTVDYDFIETYNIGIAEGRNFSREFPSDKSGAFLVNEKAVRMAGWENPIGMEISHYDGRRGTIVGVVEDFNFESVHTDIAPLYLMLDENIYSYLSIKITGDDFTGTIDNIKSIFNRFSPGTPFDFTFFDEEFEQVYRGEKRISSLFAFFSVLAIILGCLGLFGISAYSISRRRREMGVRKVFGATNMESIILICRNFLTPVILANIVAWPVSYYFLNRWLESFAYRTNISLLSFILAAGTVTVITLFTISLHSNRIALQTPAATLRTE